MAKNKTIRDPFVAADEEEVRRRKIQHLVEECPKDFAHIVRLIDGTVIKPDDLTVQPHLKPHSLSAEAPAGQRLICVFMWDNICMKIGTAGAREYDPETENSYASEALQNMPRVGKDGIDAWIRLNNDRVDFRVTDRHGEEMVDLLTLFLKIRVHHHF